MVPWWKRLFYSLVSVFLGAGLSGAWVASQQFLSTSHGRISAMGLSTAVLFFDGWVVVLALPGWLLATPLVLLVRNISGWRFWMYLAIGLCFGPALILAVEFYSAARSPNVAGFPGSSMSIVYFAAAVSGLASLIYLLLLRLGQSRSSLPTNATVG